MLLTEIKSSPLNAEKEKLIYLLLLFLKNKIISFLFTRRLAMDSIMNIFIGASRYHLNHILYELVLLALTLHLIHHKFYRIRSLFCLKV